MVTDGGSFDGQTWVVTGASSGIGRKIALDAAARGAAVCAAARREERLTDLVADMAGSGHSLKVTDVSDRDQVRDLARHVEEVHGRCDVLVNNAGFSGPPRFSGPETIPEVEKVMATNFFGAVYCTGELLPLLERSAPASVVNVTSVAGRVAVGGLAAYCSSKFALVGWSEALYPELARREIYVSSVEPGFIPTEGFPQSDLAKDPFMKHLLGSEAGVSAAVQDAVVKRKPTRVVPRWYYLTQVPKVLTPGLFRMAATKIMGARAPRDDR